MNKLLTFAALACAALAFGVSAQAEAVARPDPKLVVVISVDQFSANLFAQHRPEFTGGLGKLAREGIVYPNGYQSHAMTETCPGHSTLLTGKHPNKTGISANDWYDRASGKQVYCLGDDDSPLANDPKGRAVSPKNLMASTYGDWLKAVSPASRVLGVSGKDRGAITMSGHHADGAYWYVPGFGFTTFVPPGETAEARLRPVAAFNARLAADLKKHPFVWDYDKKLIGGSDKRCKALEADYKTGDRTWRAALPIPVAPDEAGKLRDLGSSPSSTRSRWTWPPSFATPMAWATAAGRRADRRPVGHRLYRPSLRRRAAPRCATRWRASTRGWASSWTVSARPRAGCWWS